MNTYAIGQGSMLLFLLVFLYVRIAKLSDYKILNFIMAIIVTFMVYYFIVFAYQYFTQKVVSFARVIVFSWVPVSFMSLLGANYFFFGFLKNTIIIDKINSIVSILMVLIFILAITYSYQFRQKMRRQFKKRQSIFLIISFIEPILIFGIVIFYVMNINTIYLVVILTVLFILVHFFGIHYQMLDDIPKLLDYIIDNMKDGMVILDGDLEIVDYNEKFFARLFDMRMCHNLECFLGKFNEITTDKKVMKDIHESVLHRFEDIIVGDMEVLINYRFYRYNYHISKVRDKRNQQIATMITFHDMTEIQELTQAIEEKNKLLIIANQQLKRHMENVSQLFVEKERKQLFDQINDTLGHSMIEVLALLELSVLMIDKNNEPSSIIRKLEDTTDRARKTLTEIRMAMSSYKNGEVLYD
jgi:hypothetical protein